MLEKYPKQVKVVFKHYPIRSHPHARAASAAAIVAEQRGKFWEFHDTLFEHHRNMNPETISKIVRDFGFDESAFMEATTAPGVEARIRKDMQDGQQAGVGGTPTVFVNGRQLRSRSLTGFQTAVDGELARIASRQ